MQFKWCLGYLFAAMAMVLVPSKAHAQAGVEATLDDAIGVDSDADSEVDRGDTIKYRVRVRSTGDADAESVELTVPLGADLTLLPDSVMVGPISLDDASGVNQSGSVAISVLANDRDIDGTLQPATVTVSQSPTAGTTSVDTGTGVITYTSTGAAGEDSFRYTVEDDDGLVSREALVTVLVNTCPVAQDDSVQTLESAPLNGNVLVDNGNGADADGDTAPTLSITEVNGASVNVGTEITLSSGALLTANGDGTFTYDPNGAFASLDGGADDTDTIT